MKKGLALFLLLLLPGMNGPAVTAQGKTQPPQDLCGYWQNTPLKDRDWIGPVITPDYVNFFYRIYYTDSIASPAAGTTVLYLRDNDGNRRELAVSRLAPDSVSYRFTGWDTPKTAVRKPRQAGMHDIAPAELPAALFTRWAADNRGTTGCEFYDTGRMRFHDEEWRIDRVRRTASSGEYELLLNSGDRYKLFYLRRATPACLDGASELRNYTMVPAAADPSIYRILGVWTDADPAVNAWTYGFFEKFAVYRNDFWDYESIDLKKNKGTVVLKKYGERIKLKLAFDSRRDSVCAITPEKGKKQTYIRYTVLPDYARADTSTFVDSGYRPDSVTIVGYFRGADLRNPFEISIQNFLTDRQDKFYADFDSLGRFRLTVPVLNTTETYIDWRRAGLQDVLEPGETVFLYHDFLTGVTRYMGPNARIHQELAQFYATPEYRRRRYFETIKSDVPPLEYKRIRQEAIDQWKGILENYCRPRPYLSEKFKSFQKQDCAMTLATVLMQRRFELNRGLKESFPPAYLALPDSLFRQLPRPYTLLRDAGTFVRDYVGYFNDLKNSALTLNLPPIEGLKELYRTGRYALTPAQLADLDRFEEGVRLSFYLTLIERKDSAEVAERTRMYQPAAERLQPVFEDSVLTEYLEKEWPGVSDNVLARKMFRKELGVLDSLQTEPVLRQLIFTRFMMKQFDHGRKMLPDAYLELFRDQVHHPYLLSRVEGTQQYYRDLDRQDIEYVESLKKTAGLKESQDVDDLLAQLMGPYRGKVIYIDFWGTWCSPCKEQMRYVGAVKEALKDKDVIFMYFANNSPEDSWKNVIREYHLTGPNTVHYNLPDEQQQMIQRRFSVSSFPSYVLIDRQGQVADLHAPVPENKEMLLRAIERLLKKN